MYTKAYDIFMTPMFILVSVENCIQKLYFVICTFLVTVKHCCSLQSPAVILLKFLR